MLRGWLSWWMPFGIVAWITRKKGELLPITPTITGVEISRGLYLCWPNTSPAHQNHLRLKQEAEKRRILVDSALKKLPPEEREAIEATMRRSP